LDEEDREWSVQHHLQDGVHGDQDGAVFVVSAC
jgi:hypothetical protein